MYKNLLTLTIFFSHIFSISAATPKLIVSEKTAAKIAETCDKERAENLKTIFAELHTQDMSKKETLEKLEAKTTEQTEAFNTCVKQMLEEKSREEHYTAWYTQGLAGLGCLTAMGTVLALFGSQGPNGKGMR